MSELQKKYTFDDILYNFGIFDKYYVILSVLICFAYTTNAVYCCNYIFVAETSGYRCKTPSISYNSTYNTSEASIDVCHTTSNIVDNGTCKADKNVLKPCTEFVYDDPDSFVAIFDLGCKEWKRTMVGTIHCIGYMVGLLLVGPISDRIGRKYTTVITGVLGGVFGVARSFVSSFWLYVLLEFLEASIGDICSPVFMLSIEIVATKNRAVFFMVPGFGYAFGGMILAAAAYFTPNWRVLLRVIYSPAFIFFFYLFWIDESPRWLFSKGEKDKAVAIIEKMAVTSKKVVDKNVIDNVTAEPTGRIGLPKLLKSTFASKIILKRFLVCIFWWTTCTFVSYGTHLSAVSIAGSKYLNYFLTSAVDVPGYFLTGYVLKKMKRKTSLSLAFLAGAVFCLAQPFMPSNLFWLSLVFFLAGKCMTCLYFNITYVYTSELFPTYTRNSMHALCSSTGRIGSIVAQQTPLLLVYWSGLPSVLFGCMAFIAALLTLLVPDTSEATLPDNVKQAETVGSETTI